MSAANYTPCTYGEWLARQLADIRELRPRFPYAERGVAAGLTFYDQDYRPVAYALPVDAAS